MDVIVFGQIEQSLATFFLDAKIWIMLLNEGNLFVQLFTW